MVLDYVVVAKMRYYRDLSVNYNYLEDSGRKIYDDKIIKQGKEAAKTVDPFHTGVGVTFSTSLM